MFQTARHGNSFTKYPSRGVSAFAFSQRRSFMNNLNRVTDEIFTIPDLLSKQECEHWIQASESLGYQAASINTETGPRRKADVRNNDRVLFDNEPEAAKLWLRIADHVPPVVRSWKVRRLNERMRFYRYDVGQKFDWHADGSFHAENGEQSFVTFMVYLNDDFKGGETAFRKGIRIAPQQGMALLFFHWLKHKGDEVDEGRKYVLRSDVMYAKSDDK